MPVTTDAPLRADSGRLTPGQLSADPRELAARGTARPAAAPSAPEPERGGRRESVFFSRGLLKDLHLGGKASFGSEIILSEQVTVKEMEFMVILGSVNHHHTISNISTATSDQRTDTVCFAQ